MNNNRLFLLCAGLLSNLSAPQTTAIVRGLDGDDSALRVPHESGISGRELARMIEDASEIALGISFAKLRLGLYLGKEELKEAKIVPDGAVIGRLCRGSELRVSLVNKHSDYDYYIQYGEMNFRVYTKGLIPSTLEDLLNCQLINLGKLHITKVIFLNQDMIYVMQAMHNFVKANPKVEIDTLEDYLNLIFTLTLEKPEYTYSSIMKMFPMIDLTQADEIIRNKLIGQLQVSTNPHAQNMRQIIEDAGIRVEGLEMQG